MRGFDFPFFQWPIPCIYTTVMLCLLTFQKSANTCLAPKGALDPHLGIPHRALLPSWSPSQVFLCRVICSSPYVLVAAIRHCIFSSSALDTHSGNEVHSELSSDFWVFIHGCVCQWYRSVFLGGSVCTVVDSLTVSAESKYLL